MEEPRTQIQLCELQYAAGIAGACPDSRCPLWHAGGVLDGYCVLERLEHVDAAALATWLPRAREAIQHAQTERERVEVRELYVRLLTDASR